MIVSLKAQITLNAEEIKEALTQYIHNNGFDMDGKNLELPTELPDSITVEVETNEATEYSAAKAKPKAKPKAEVKPQSKPEVKAEPVVEAASEPQEDQPVEEESTTEVEPKVPAYKQPASEDEKAKASAEVQAAIEATQALLKTDKPKARPTNIFADPAPEPADLNADAVYDADMSDDMPFGQDALDNPKPEQPKKPSSNPFANTGHVSRPARNTINANKLFG